MVRTKVKTMKVSGTSDEDVKSLNKMFSQITGASDAERDVLIPKINTIYKSIIEYNRLYNIILNYKPFTSQFEEYSFWFDDISTFLKDLIKTTDTDIKKKYEETNETIYYNLDDKDLNVFYKNLKDNTCIKKMIITGSNLAVFKKHLTEPNKLDDCFINREPGITLQPLAFSTLDLKLIWNSENINERDKKIVLTILSHTLSIGIALYNIVTSPDVDIKKFSKILVESIAKMKKQIPRCDRAFAIIEKSVLLLETNFKTYFRESVEASNPNIIVENFILDISTSQKAGPSVANEFKRIVMFLKEKSGSNNDPKVKKLFEMLNTQFSAMDTELGVKDSSGGSSSTESTAVHTEPLGNDSTVETSEQSDLAETPEQPKKIVKSVRFAI